MARTDQPGRWLGVFAGGVVAAFVCALIAHGSGLSAIRQPAPGEDAFVTGIRQWLLPEAYRNFRNPVGAAPAVLVGARREYAEDCAVCHGNDGRGRTDTGAAMFPAPPDFETAAEQQALTDGALFYAMKAGIPFSGMPAWGDRLTDEQLGQLLVLIRHFPNITRAEVAEMESVDRLGGDK